MDKKVAQENTEAPKTDESENKRAPKSAPTKKKGKIWKRFCLLIALTILAGAIGYGYTQYVGLPDSLLLNNQHDDVVETEVSVSPAPSVMPIHVQQPIPETSEDIDISVFDKEQPELVVSQDEIVEVPVNSPVIVEPKAITPQPLEVKQIPEATSTEPTPDVVSPKKKIAPQTSYSILKAIELRDAFKNGGECRPLLEELVAMPNKSAEMDQALMDLLQACLDRPLNGQMQQAFASTKKRAILRIFQNQHPTYLAYIKALPYFLANVRKKNPTGDNPLDTLDRIQNAVNEDRPQLVLKLIPELPENVQATLNDVTQYAEAEANLYKTLNHLMKALFDGEEKQ